jgi:hypothetical protein
MAWAIMGMKVVLHNQTRTFYIVNFLLFEELNFHRSTYSVHNKDIFEAMGVNEDRVFRKWACLEAWYICKILFL